MTRISIEEYRALLKKRGNKSDKAAQPAFTHNDKTIRAITYRADFVYIDKKDGLPHIIDVKGSKETLTEVYKLKRKLLLYQGYEIEEVY